MTLLNLNENLSAILTFPYIPEKICTKLTALKMLGKGEIASVNL